MKVEKICQVAIIGAGYMAGEHIRVFQDIPGVCIAGIHSRTKARAEQIAAQFGIAKVCNSIEELYQATQADLVIVTVPELEMNGVSRACFNYPWVALLEKPAGYNYADALEIEAAARSNHSRVFVALNRRHYSSTQAVTKDLQGLSGLRFIRVEDQEDQIRALDAGQPRLVVDNWMYANSIHVIDYFLLMGRGQITAVEAIVPWLPEMPHFVAAKITFDSGDVGLYEAVWNRPGPWAVTVSAPERRWEMRPLEQAAYQEAGQRKMAGVEPHPWDVQFKPGLRLQAEKAVAATRGEVVDLPTLQESLKVMRLVRDIYTPR